MANAEEAKEQLRRLFDSAETMQSSDGSTRAIVDLHGFSPSEYREAVSRVMQAAESAAGNDQSVSFGNPLVRGQQIYLHPGLLELDDAKSAGLWEALGSVLEQNSKARHGINQLKDILGDGFYHLRMENPQGEVFYDIFPAYNNDLPAQGAPCRWLPDVLNKAVGKPVFVRQKSASEMIGVSLNEAGLETLLNFDHQATIEDIFTHPMDACNIFLRDPQNPLQALAGEKFTVRREVDADDAAYYVMEAKDKLSGRADPTKRMAGALNKILKAPLFEGNVTPDNRLMLTIEEKDVPALVENPAQEAAADIFRDPVAHCRSYIKSAPGGIIRSQLERWF